MLTLGNNELMNLQFCIKKDNQSFCAAYVCFRSSGEVIVQDEDMGL